MPDQPLNDPPSRQPDNQSFTPSPMQLAVEKCGVTKKPIDASGYKNEETKHIFGTVKNGEVAIIATNFVLIVLTGVIACIYNGQLTQMRKATDEATKATKATRSAVYETCRQSQISRAALLQAIQAGYDAHDSAIASTYQTMVSTQAEAADVSPFIDRPNLQVGLPMGFPLHIKNTGKSSAKKVIMHSQTILVGRNEDPIATYPIGRSALSVTPTLFADTEVSSLVGRSIFEKLEDGTERLMTVADAKDISDGKKDLLIFVKIAYEDSLKVLHWIKYCRTFPAVDSGVGKNSIHSRCVNYNQTDSNTIFHPANHPNPDIAIPEISCTKPDPN